MALLSLTATDWTYRTDLSQGVGQFDANYVEVAGFSPSETVFNNATLGDRVDIYVLSQGSYQLLADFVIDDYRIHETADGVTASISGRDSKALLLERFPVFTGAASTDHILRSENGSTTYKGMTVASDGTVTYQATAVTALADLVQRAGFTPNINIDDYALGVDFAHGTETSFGDAILALLQPVRLTEKYHADVILDGNTLWIWQRDKGAPFGTVNIPYNDFVERSIERQRPTLTSSVQVQGTSYQFFEAEPVQELTQVVPGWPAKGPYTRRFGPVIVKDPNSGIDLHTKQWEADYDLRGLVTTFRYNVVYHNYPIYDHNGILVTIEPHIRRESITQTFTHEATNTLDPAATPRMTKLVDEKFVEDFTHIKLWDKAKLAVVEKHQNYISQITQRIETTWTYPDMVGASDAEKEHARRTGAVAEESISYEVDTAELIIPAGKSVPTSSFAPLQIKNRRGFQYIQSGNQLIRMAVDEGHDPTSTGPSIIAETRFPEIAPGEVPTASQGATAPTNQRSVTRQIICGPDSANEKIGLPRIGRESDACRVRDQVIDARKAWAILGNFSMLPNLNIREGMQMAVTGAPTRWQTTSFYIAGRSFERTADGLLMRLVGLAWI